MSSLGGRVIMKRARSLPQGSSQKPQRLVNIPIDAMHGSTNRIRCVERRLEIHTGHQTVLLPQAVQRLEGCPQHRVALISSEATQESAHLIVLLRVSLQPSLALWAELHGDVRRPDQSDQFTDLLGAPLRDVRCADEVHLTIGARIAEVRERITLRDPAQISALGGSRCENAANTAKAPGDTCDGHRECDLDRTPRRDNGATERQCYCPLRIHFKSSVCVYA